ncbi:MAG: radical SAM protein [Desulfobacterales bacterium]|nr:radical SAM protein [Desulfobacterales bacterium]
MSEGRLRPLIVPIFIPNHGCPHQCVFCEQEKITSQPSRPVNANYVEEVLKKAIRSNNLDPRQKREVAFYGGTFTRLPITQIRELLGAVAPYIKQGVFQSIRVSTRPDALDEERLKLMKRHNVRTVELGAQSMDNEVLSLSQRGHSTEDIGRAVRVLKMYEFELGIQLMPGLPGDSKEKFYKTISEVIILRPDMVRLYPAVVIKGTELADWYEKGKYHPWMLEQAVNVCVESCMRLEAEGIPVIRIGLMSSPALLEKGQIVAGPWHPSFGFLVRSGIYRKALEQALPGPGMVSRMSIRVPEKDIPLIRGYKNQGLEWIERKTGARVIGVESDDSISPGNMRFQEI